MRKLRHSSNRRTGSCLRRGCAAHDFDQRLTFEQLEDRQMLAVFTVTNLDDSGSGSLRDAVAMANATVEADTVDFAAALAGGTIALTTGEMQITQTLTIDGSALSQSVTIDANLQSRIFNFTAATGDFSLSGLSLTEGRTTADNVLLGPVGPISTTQNGAAVRFNSTGTLTIDRSLISGNRTEGFAAVGGAIFAQGDLVVRDSTVSGNQTQDSVAFGGGIFGFGSFTLTRSTVTGNQSGYSGGGLAVFANSLVINGSIVAGNTSAGGSPDVFNSGGSPAVNFSLIGSTLGSGISGSSGVGNVLNQPALLGPLTFHGGATKTHSLLTGSLAINSGDPDAEAGDGNTPLNDQRGAPFTRVVGGRIDMGAFESQPISLVVDTLVDTSDDDFSPGNLSLREALAQTAANPGADTIGFDDALAGGSIALMAGQLVITDILTLTGLGDSQLTIDAQGNSRVLAVSGVADVRIIGLTLTGGSSDFGGALRVDPGTATTLTDVVIEDSEASADGGGVHNRGQLTILESTIRDNTATSASSRGGGIWNDGDLEIQRSTLSGNDAGINALGGGIFHDDGTLTIAGSTLSGNTAGYGGGGVGNFDARLNISGSTLAGNIARYGGGVFNRYGTATITGSTLTGNMANLDGGGIFNDGYGTLSLSHTIVSGNTAPTGSELRVASGTATVNVFNLFGHIGTTTTGALDGVSPGSTDITATSNGTHPTSLSGVLDVALADNGGSTLTPALPPGSPAIDAGNASAIVGDGDTPIYDQRGAPHTRVFGGRIDIGAIEVQTLPALIGDYNQNDVVDAADYTVWRNTLGQNGLTANSGADGDGDGMIDLDDYRVWKSNFGKTLPQPAAMSNTAGLSLIMPASEVVETVVPVSAKTTTAIIRAKADDTTGAGFAVFNARSIEVDLAFRSRDRVNIFGVTESAGDNPLLLLAIDRLRHSYRQDLSLFDDLENDDWHGNNPEDQSLNDSFDLSGLAVNPADRSTKRTR